VRERLPSLTSTGWVNSSEVVNQNIGDGFGPDSIGRLAAARKFSAHSPCFDQHGPDALHAVVFFVPALLHNIVEVGAQLFLVLVCRSGPAVCFIKKVNRFRLIGRGEGKHCIGAVWQLL
jgi:hypothetical protein